MACTADTLFPMEMGSSSSTTNGYAIELPRLDVDQLRTLRTLSELKEGPIPAVLDTSCVRTGLHYQLVNDRLPASMDFVRSGRFRMFMELETLNEAWNLLPRFAQQLGVPVSTLQRIFADDWLPLLSIVSLPESLRQIDQRAEEVRLLDSDDYPTAALAALLSPCILLTRNSRDFGPLDVKVHTQGLDAVFAAVNVKVGETHVQAIVMIPAAPVVAVGATTKWAAEKVGPMAWFVLALLVAGGALLYQRQPPERKERIKHVTCETGKFLIDEYERATIAVQQAEDQLATCVVSGPGNRSATSAIFRKLALSDDSMSAQQLCDVLDGSVRPAVDQLRRFLHDNKTTVFREVRRGGFVLGGRYHVTLAIEG